MSQYQNFCFSKKKNVNLKSTILGIGSEIAPIQFNLKTNIGKKLRQPPLFLKGVGKDLSRTSKSSFLPLKRKCPSDGLFLRFKRVYPRVRSYYWAGHQLDVHKQQAQKTIGLNQFNFYNPMVSLWARPLKIFNSSVSNILVKTTKDMPKKSTLNLTKKFNKQVIRLTSKYFRYRERKNLCLSPKLIKGLDGAYELPLKKSVAFFKGLTLRKEKQNFFILDKNLEVLYCHQ